MINHSSEYLDGMEAAARLVCVHCRLVDGFFDPQPHRDETGMWMHNNTTGISGVARFSTTCLAWEIREGMNRIAVASLESL
jgi:hypothetical protein